MPTYQSSFTINVFFLNGLPIALTFDHQENKAIPERKDRKRPFLKQVEKKEIKSEYQSCEIF